MENSSPSRSFFSSSTSDHPLITSGHVVTSNNLSIPWIGSIGSTRRSGSAASSPRSAGSPPGDQDEMARRNLKRILHLISPLSSVEDSDSPSRVVKSTAKVVPPMKVGTKEDDVLVMDAVPIQFSCGMEEQRGSRFIKSHKSEEESRAQRSPRTPQTPSPTTSMASPLSKEETPKKEEAVLEKKDVFWSPTPEQETVITKEKRKAQRSRTPQIIPSATSPSLKDMTPKKEEAVPEKKDFIWPPTQEEEAIITKVLYTPSGKKRLPVFVSICPK